jgi:hypothetical protein
MSDFKTAEGGPVRKDVACQWISKSPGDGLMVVLFRRGLRFVFLNGLPWNQHDNGPASSRDLGSCGYLDINVAWSHSRLTKQIVSREADFAKAPALAKASPGLRSRRLIYYSRSWRRRPILPEQWRTPSATRPVRAASASKNRADFGS